jgi:DNA-binding NarL/FixJ family response regulator
MNILLVDDHALFREGFKLMLERRWREPTHVVEVGTVEEGLAAAAHDSFDLIFLDLGLPGMGGMDALRAMRAACPTTTLVVLSGNQSPETVRLALGAGAQGYIPKSMSPFDTAGALERILAGEVYTPLAVETGEESEFLLTGRQMEVLTELCAGRSNREIAERLGLTENTVRVHASAIFRLLNVRSRTEAVLLAKRRGWC